MSTYNDNIGLYIKGHMVGSGLVNLVVSGQVPNPYDPPLPPGSSIPGPSIYNTATSLFISNYYTGSPNVENSANLYIKTMEYDDYANPLYLYIEGPRPDYETSTIESPLFIGTIDIGTTPDTITGLTLWLDGYDSSNFTFSSSNNISTWADKSSFHNDFTVKTYNSPTYDSTNKVVNFANNQTLVHNDYYMNLFNEYTVFIVADNIGTGLLLAGVSDDMSSFYASAPISALGINEATKIELESYVLSKKFYEKIAGFTYGNTQPVPNNNGIFTMARSTSQLDFIYDGSQMSSFTISDPLSKINFGSLNGYMDGEGLDNIAIKEVIIYNRRLTDSEIQNLNTHLQVKWNIYNPLYQSSTLFVKCEQVSMSSGSLNLYIDRPEHQAMPLVLYNRLVDQGITLYTRCATYSTNSGVSIAVSGSDVPTSGIPLYMLGS